MSLKHVCLQCLPSSQPTVEVTKHKISQAFFLPLITDMSQQASAIQGSCVWNFSLMCTLSKLEMILGEERPTVLTTPLLHEQMHCSSPFIHNLRSISSSVCMCSASMLRLLRRALCTCSRRTVGDAAKHQFAKDLCGQGPIGRVGTSVSCDVTASKRAVKHGAR